MARFFRPTKAKPKPSNIAIRSVIIDKHDHHGKGLVLTSSPITIVAGALVGESVQIEEYQNTKKVSNAKVIAINTQSSQRVVPFCEYYNSCGGCSMQHTGASYGFYLKFKALDEYLVRYLKLPLLPWQSPVLANIYYEDANFDDRLSQLLQAAINSNAEQTGNQPGETKYRRRVRLAMDARQKNNIKLGFRKRQSSDVINIEHCPIASLSINQFIEIIQSNFKDLEISRIIGHIILTEGSETTQAAFYMSKQPSIKAIDHILELVERENQSCIIILKNKIVAFSERSAGKVRKSIVGHKLDVSQTEGNPLFDESAESINAITLQDALGLKTKIKSHHFLQVNKDVNRQMLSLAKNWLQPSKNNILYDFYCGSGNFALYLAPFVKHVYAFEGVLEMVLQAKENAASLSVNNCDFSCEDLSNQTSLHGLKLPDGAIVIIDPSRDGALELCRFLSTSNAEKVLYVSCNPNSFSRDVISLLPRFTLNKIVCLDMFPFTEHIEVVALFCSKH